MGEGMPQVCLPEPRDWYSGAAERAMAAPSASKVPSILGQVPPILGQSAPNFRPKCLEQDCTRMHHLKGNFLKKFWGTPPPQTPVHTGVKPPPAPSPASRFATLDADRVKCPPFFLGLLHLKNPVSVPVNHMTYDLVGDFLHEPMLVNCMELGILVKSVAQNLWNGSNWLDPFVTWLVRFHRAKPIVSVVEIQKVLIAFQLSKLSSRKALFAIYNGPPVAVLVWLLEVGPHWLDQVASCHRAWAVRIHSVEPMPSFAETVWRDKSIQNAFHCVSQAWVDAMPILLSNERPFQELPAMEASKYHYG